MKKRLLYLILPLVTLILEIIPFGAVCNFAVYSPESTAKVHRVLCSYFDLVPFGYANFAPMFTALLTCIIITLMLFYCLFGKKRALTAVKILLCVAAVISVCPILLGIKFYSIVGALITVSLIAEAIWLFKSEK